jgi:YVTN family beta-propeller protein
MRAWIGNDPSSGPYYFPLDLAVGAGAVWVSNGSLLRLDPATGTIVASIPDVTVVAVGESRVWAANQEGRVARIDPSTNLVARTSVVTNSADDIAAGQGAVWVMNSDDDSVARVDPATVRVTATPVRVGRTPKAVAAGGGAVWVMSERDGTVTRIDPATFDVKTLDVGGTPQDLAVGAGGVWVAVRA